MNTTFEIILSQAKNLSSAEKKKLIKTLVETENSSEKKKMQNNKKVLAELKKVIDEREKTPDSELSKSAKIAENIRQENDRGFSL